MQRDINIREARYGDIHQLIELLRALFAIEEDFIFDKEKQKKGLEMMLQNEKRSCVLVAEFKDQVIGMVSGQALVSTAEGGISVLVEDVVIDENYRGRGIGKKLLKEIEKWAVRIGAKRLQLLADINNTKALDFYKGLNWTGTRLVCLQKKEKVDAL